MKALALSLVLLATPALAAPTCQDRNGDTIKCGAPGAMPVGWTLPPEEAWRLRLVHTETPAGDVLKVVMALALFFALIALMPRFDGRHDQDWL
jgi:hypothetical protein